ncbi:MAG TPA: PH domain-containing protein [Candidatus Saccharimonadales bacterium]|nr:PH domain-containing protein [Candidatus Saccharimonadales bacterium]
MVHPSIIEARLGELRFKASRWFQAEINELQHILMDHEKIIALACGRYFGSFALLVATDQRLLLIDKRVFFMNYEDTRYDMISEIDFNSQFYSATLTVFTVNKTHRFTSVKHRQQLRDITNYVQKRVAQLRSHAAQQDIPPLAPAAPAAPPLGTSYSYSPATSDDHSLAFTSQHDVAHIVGSTAVQASHAHHWPQPFNPYIQGSLTTRRPYGGSQSYQETL